MLDINPCGENRPLVIQTTDNGFIDSSVLAFDDDTLLNCEWKLKVTRDKSLTVTADNIKLDNRHFQFFYCMIALYPSQAAPKQSESVCRNVPVSK